MSDPFTLDDAESELRDAPPRRVRWTPLTGAIRRIGWNLLLACFCLCYFVGTYLNQQWRELATTGTVTTAHVVAKHILPDNATTYRVDYEFTQGRQRVIGYHDLALSAYSNTQVGDTFVVTCLPKNPAVYEEGKLPADYVSMQLGRMVAGMSASLLALLMFLIACESRFTDQRNLLRDAQIAVATVVDRRPGLFRHIITYDIVYPDGSEASGEVAIGQSERGRFVAGSPMTMLLREGQVYTAVPYVCLKFAEVEG